MATAEQLQAEFVQEVVAASVYARTAHPEAKALIDIGGEDAKVIFFKKNGNMELRMNGNCAGGTGAFIDQMSVLMGVENQKMSELAMKAEHVYPMAARCGVRQDRHPEPDGTQSARSRYCSQHLPFHRRTDGGNASHGISFEAPYPALRRSADLSSGSPQGFLRLSPSLTKRFHRIRKQQSHSGSGLCLPG